MFLWIVSIGELDKQSEFEAINLREAKTKAIHWLYEIHGKPAGDWLEHEDEPERKSLQVQIPIFESWIRPSSWFFRLFGRPIVKRRPTLYTTTLSLSVVHEEMADRERVQFCSRLGLYAED